jgi:NhaP-type Na+/H+ or K+/H+ antiporter
MLLDHREAQAARGHVRSIDDETGIDGGGALKGLVFLTILLTVGVQGATAPWLARRLGLTVLEGEAETGIEGMREQTTAEAGH